ncbi:hypothetical protein [Streptomyces sp. NPDC058657]|uniref:hypothetical protein n=1 Tax=unclassified Streptomyces TaxID=2593676 RepID=UPI00364EFDE4
MIHTLTRTSAALGLAASALLTALPAQAATADAPSGASLSALTAKGGADRMVDRAADLTLHTLVGEANNTQDGLVGAVLPSRSSGLNLDGSGTK